MNFNCPVAETIESIEPNDNNLELNVIAYTFLRSIPTWTVTAPSAIVNSLHLSLWVSPQSRTRKLKTRTLAFSAVEDSTLLWWHSGTQKCIGKAKQRDQIDNEGRFFWKSIVKTKHQSLTSLTFIRLVPGANWVVRHICIQCMSVQIQWYKLLTTFENKIDYNGNSNASLNFLQMSIANSCPVLTHAIGFCKSNFFCACLNHSSTMLSFVTKLYRGLRICLISSTSQQLFLHYYSHTNWSSNHRQKVTIMQRNLAQYNKLYHTWKYVHEASRMVTQLIAE